MILAAREVPKDVKTNGRTQSREKKSRRCPRVRATREVTLPSVEENEKRAPAFSCAQISQSRRESLFLFSEERRAELVIRHLTPTSYGEFFLLNEKRQFFACKKKKCQQQHGE